MTSKELDLLQGTLDVLVLRALSWGPAHGYAVARFIRAGSDNTFKVLDGALYTSNWLTATGPLLLEHVAS